MEKFSTVDEFKDACGYTIDGAWYPRVTKIVDIKSKPALYRYYAEAKSYKHAQDSTEKSAQEGTLIHEILEKILVGEKTEIPPSIAPAISAAEAFLERKQIHVDPAFVERRVVSYTHGYAGTIDALALIDGKLGVLDIKTSQSIYRDYCLQTSAYMDPLIAELGNVQTRWILRVDQVKTCELCGATLRQKGGRDKVRRPYPWNGRKTCLTADHVWSDLHGVTDFEEFPYWKNDFDAFLSAKRLWEWEHETWLKRVGYLR
ncbi:MAG: hypothetical protein COU07_00515 [Candidatus Harrisonbacteria bacterium CG10_big_fil_rev_8_21_14_0_10_40_38]|uniref:PD-(D/E)XK endonuclease-like domain-containing protein n=1 Tax=Candidatus Harrisonbacteria bacterium CG10_big_fil_rev_8_21_14_0_10_40_38 TaxID=1974583 RepID=A0A2H0USH9_9BACT|nr:MAG: hypothetical protein COU07_00515 [Candidatus Harrisonbacteria bacterium CG10_big_fil_rev_8_21_14_0_10_40_38]